MSEKPVSESERRERLVKLGSAIGFLALAVVAVLIVISQSDSSGGDASNIEGVAKVEAELRGIPQNGLILGSGNAKVTLVEFGDLQCPTCKGYAEEVLPSVIDNKVRSGKARLEYRNFVIVDEQSAPAAAAATAAGMQGRGWNFIELFYRNQGLERSGYVTDEFLTAIARASDVPDIAQWNRDRKSNGVIEEVSRTTDAAHQMNFGGTPSFAIEGPATAGLESLGTPGSSGELESAIEDAS